MKSDARRPLDTLPPLWHARRRPGRPRKIGHVAGTSASQGAGKTGASGSALVLQAVAPVLPRLLDLHGAAMYLALSEWTLRDLEASGTLHRVRIPLPNGGELRKLLFDRIDLDRLIEAWKDTQ